MQRVRGVSFIMFKLTIRLNATELRMVQDFIVATSSSNALVCIVIVLHPSTELAVLEKYCTVVLRSFIL